MNCIQLFKEGVQMAKKYLKVSASSPPGKCKLKQLRSSLLPSHQGHHYKNQRTINADKDDRKEEPSFVAGKNANWHRPYRNLCAGPSKEQKTASPASPTTPRYIEDSESTCHRCICRFTFIAIQLTMTN